MTKIAIILFLVAICPLQVALAETVSITSPSTSLSISLPNSKAIRVELRTEDTPAGYIYGNAYEWGGNNQGRPQTVVAGIDVYDGGNKTPVPLSAFADLGTPRIVKVQATGSNQFSLTIRGGDAAGAYTATLRFQGSALVARKVTSGEFPDQVWEETKYVFDVGNN